MLKISNVKIIYKILACFVLLGFVVGGAIWFATSKMKEIDVRYSAILDNEVKALADGLRVNQRALNFARLFWREIAETDAAEMKKIAADMVVNQKEMNEFFENAKKHAPKFAERYNDAHKLAKQLYEDYKPLEVATLSDNNKEALRIAKTLLPKATALRKAISQVNTELQKEMDGKSDQATADTNATVTITIASISGALALVLGLAFLLVQFGVAKPLGTLIGLLKRMEGGEEVEITGTERKDEIGDTANAVNGIKAMLAEKARQEAEVKAEQARREAELARSEAEKKAEQDRLLAEAKIEQDKQAAAEREAAMQKMADEFEAAIGGIVQAAIAGDFTQRVELQGKSGLVLNVGTAINSLCENVAKALDDLINMLNSLAEGNLTDRITAEYQGNFAVLKDNANKTAERIGSTISEIKSSAREVTNASAEISTSTTDLSQRTEEQAASLEETSASMEEISATVKKNAENAQVANQSAASTREVATRGGQVVAEAVTAMAKIEDSSRKIADIIGVIDEIARQTNLLALNAAVEAARAGDAGRGFAVVASEVRSLAQRSSQAAKDIKDLITSSNVQVKEGVDLVNRTGSSLNEIVESIKKVAEIVADIANASAEQASGIEQVNKALTQMDEVTQQNSALVEENAATSKTLEHQAKAMDERVAFFRLVGDTAEHSEQPSNASERRALATPLRGPAAASRQQPAAAPKRATAGGNSGGPVRRMQTALASAVNGDPEWQEF